MATARDLQRWARRGTTTARGLGHEHQALRARLLAQLLTGGPRPCRRCGQPMTHPDRCPAPPDRDDRRCFHCRLDLGHHTPRALGGAGPRDLEHARCNRVAGAQLRGALTRLTPRTTRRW